MEMYFESAKKFAISYFKAKSGSSNVTEVGVVVSSVEPFVAVPMSAPGNRFTQNVNDIAFNSAKKGAQLGSALKMASSSFFQRNPIVNEILIIITDGVHSGDREILFEQAREFHQRGVSIYVIGLGEDYDFDVLRRVASDEERVRLVPSADGLSDPSFIKEFAQATRATPGESS